MGTVDDASWGPPWVLRMPPWLFGIAYTALVTVAYALALVTVSGRSWSEVWSRALLLGAIVGPAVTWTHHQRRRALARGLAGFGFDEREEAVRAAGRGPVPSDPRVRSLAHSFAQRRLERAEDARRAAWLVGPLASVAVVGLVAAGGGPWPLALLACLGLTVAAVLGVPRARRREELLRPPPAPVDQGAPGALGR